MQQTFNQAWWEPTSDEVETPIAIFGAEIEGLPIFWDEGSALDMRQRREQEVIERQLSFTRALGLLRGQVQFELRIVCDPDSQQHVRLFYLVSVEETGDPETVWRMFHNAFPYDLDFRLRILASDEARRICETPLGAQRLLYYEWKQIPTPIQLGNQTATLWMPPALRPDGLLTLLRTLLQHHHPIMIGFTVKPVEADQDILDQWKTLLDRVETIQSLLRTAGGLIELVKRYDELGSQIMPVLAQGVAADEMTQILLERVIESHLREGYSATLSFQLELAQDVARRMLQSSTHFRYRVHAAIPKRKSVLDPVIQRAIADELGRSQDGRVVSRHKCDKCDVDPRDDWAGDNVRYIRLNVPVSESDDPARFIIDEIGATALLRLPILPPGGLPGIRSFPANPFTSWQLEEDMSQEGIEIGEYIDSRVSLLHKRQRGVSISLNDLTRHALITGSTGSGKSTTSKRILAELHRRGVPFMVIEPVKAEYGDLAFTNEITDKLPYPYFFEPGSVDEIWFNPFYIRKGLSLNTHLSYLASCFMAAFPLFDVQAMVLKKVLHAAYRKKFEGKPFYIDESTPIQEDLTDEEAPSLPELTQIAEEEIEKLGYGKDFTSELRAAIALRLQHLQDGVIGRVLQNAGNNPSFERQLEKFLQKPVVIQLRHIGNKDEKALLMAFILMAMYEYYEQQPTSPTLRHVTLIEEAHVLLEGVSRAQSEERANPRGKAIELFADMLAEIRSRGEGLIIVEQLPSKLIPEAIKNSNLKIMHRLTAREDRDVLGAAMNFNEWQSRFATTLQRGQAIIFREGLSQPALVQIAPVESRSEVRSEVDRILASLSRDEYGNPTWPQELIELFMQEDVHLDQALSVSGRVLASRSKQIRPGDRQAALWFLYQLTRPFSKYSQRFYRLIEGSRN